MLRRELLVRALWGSAACASAGCGTLFHKDRINRPHSRDLDWSVVALNGLGLLFFFVPGVIAFIVDFHTGAIYLPPEEVAYPAYGAVPPPEYSPPTQFAPPAGPHTSFAPPKVFDAAEHAPAHHLVAQNPTAGTPSLRQISAGPGPLDAPRIEALLAAELGRPVRLDADATRVNSIGQLADYAAHRRQSDVDPSYGTPLRQFFQRLRQA